MAKKYIVYTGSPNKARGQKSFRNESSAVKFAKAAAQAFGDKKSKYYKDAKNKVGVINIAVATGRKGFYPNRIDPYYKRFKVVR